MGRVSPGCAATQLPPSHGLRGDSAVAAHLPLGQSSVHTRISRSTVAGSGSHLSKQEDVGTVWHEMDCATRDTACEPLTRYHLGDSPK